MLRQIFTGCLIGLVLLGLASALFAFITGNLILVKVVVGPALGFIFASILVFACEAD
jgi:hypothetical protein